MKLGPLFILNKRNTKTSEKLENDLMLANCDAIVLFSILSLFWTIPETESRQMLHDIKIFISFHLLSNKKWKQNQKKLTQSLRYWLENRYIFAPKLLIFYIKWWHQQNERGPGISMVLQHLYLYYLHLLSWKLSSF